LLNILKVNNNILIYIKGSPDPDAIASSYTLKLICDSLNINSQIFSKEIISLEQNKKMIENFGIPIIFKSIDFYKFSSYAVLDYQTSKLSDVPERMKCIIHIDHHDFFEESPVPDFKLQTGDVNSVSTIMAGILKAMKNSETILEKCSSPLLLGIMTDTNNLKLATHTDIEMYDFVKSQISAEEFNRISTLNISDETLTIISKAIMNSENYKNWIIAGIGLIPEKIRDSIAITADYILENNEAQLVIVFAGIIKDGGDIVIDASFRTKKKNMDLTRIIKTITANGGGRRFKGAYQISVGYLSTCPDRKLIWDVISATTIAHLKNIRDNIPMMEIKGVFNKIKSGFENIFRKD